MKIKLFLVILLAILFILNSCRESINQANDDNPNIAGDYTEISGNIKGTLSISDSPFLINEDVNILSGDTLFIESGAGLYFKENTGLNINGTIIAIGIKEQPILFTPNITQNKYDHWRGISIENGSSQSEFKFCIIEAVYQPSDSGISFGAIKITNSKVEISNCIFRYNYTTYGGGLCLINSQANIINNIFRDNDTDLYGAAIFIQNSTASIVNNTFFYNFSHNVGGAIVFENPLHTEVQNNIFRYNYSFNGDERLAVIAGDSTNILQQYNYLDPDTLNPRFVSTSDLHLTAGSICRDSGNPEEEFNDFDGTRNDQGAYGGPGGNW